MPRDVATRWNSTFDMLDYTLEHREAVDTVMQQRDLGLQKYELEDNEWEILQQLRDILKVCTLCLTLWRICLCYIVCSC